MRKHRSSGLDKTDVGIARTARRLMAQIHGRLETYDYGFGGKEVAAVVINEKGVGFAHTSRPCEEPFTLIGWDVLAGHDLGIRRRRYG
jgi:hypothetical protein